VIVCCGQQYNVADDARMCQIINPSYATLAMLCMLQVPMIPYPCYGTTTGNSIAMSFVRRSCVTKRHFSTKCPCRNSTKSTRGCRNALIVIAKGVTCRMAYAIKEACKK
jgi:hypothetical protein